MLSYSIFKLTIFILLFALVKSKSKEPTCQCGRILGDSSVSSSNDEPNSPWLLSVMVSTDKAKLILENMGLDIGDQEIITYGAKNYTHVCTATIISVNGSITDNSCVVNPETKTFLLTNEIILRTMNGSIIDVVFVKSNSTCTKGKNKPTFAHLTSNPAFVWSNLTYPVCLSDKTLSRTFLNKKVLYIAGLDQNGTNQFNYTTALTSQSECVKKMDQEMAKCGDSTFCTKSSTYPNRTCDVGGPLTLATSNLSPNLYVCIGVDLPFPKKKSCNTDLALFTRVDAAWKWLKKEDPGACFIDVNEN